MSIFSDEFDILRQLNLVEFHDRKIRLTASGRRHRDLAVQLFFSQAVRGLVSDFSYRE